mmetsp:Transcript_7774/g.28448  ORF Transcript_7774/g.28448 Transcript_7774/m.28448 type:complete len:128 (+) Transcript_7774:1323-1706(+)
MNRLMVSGMMGWGRQSCRPAITGENATLATATSRTGRRRRSPLATGILASTMDVDSVERTGRITNLQNGDFLNATGMAKASAIGQVDARPMERDGSSSTEAWELACAARRVAWSRHVGLVKAPEARG